MSLFNHAKAADRAPEQPAENAGRKIILNFGFRKSKTVREMAVATLEAGGFDLAPAAPKPPEIGDVMEDGTKYAGISPDTGKPMYVMSADAPITMEWKEAMDYAANIGMRLPTKDELNVLFNNRAAIGGFNLTGSATESWYWSATAATSKGNYWYAWYQMFSEGSVTFYNEINRSAVRCIR